MTETRNRIGTRWILLAPCLFALAFAAWIIVEKSGDFLPPVVGKVPAFSLIEKSGRTITNENLRNKIWIADFVFTNCGGSCPSMSRKMSELQKDLISFRNVYFVSFSVDPKRDTPAVLSEYAGAYEPSSERWLFLTGDEKKLYTLIQTDFHLPVDPNGGASDEPIIHSTYFVVIDGTGSIRGYYDSNDPLRMQKLSVDVKRLAKKG